MTGEQRAISAVIVTHNRAELLRRCLDAVVRQDVALRSIFVVDNASVDHTADVIAGFPEVSAITLAENLGGAAGYAIGIERALADGAETVWLMDDDGVPAAASCVRLLAEGLSPETPFRAPLVTDIEDAARLAFPIRIAGTSHFLTAAVTESATIPNFAALFNGALIHASVFKAIGLPNPRFYLWGDETEFLYRARKANIPIELDTSVHFRHPSSRPEIFPIMFGLFYAVVPQTAFKRKLLFRNRAYIFLKYRMWIYLFADVARYGWFFLISSRFDLAGFGAWLGSTLSGLGGPVHASADFARRHGTGWRHPGSELSACASRRAGSDAPCRRPASIRRGVSPLDGVADSGHPPPSVLQRVTFGHQADTAGLYLRAPDSRRPSVSPDHHLAIPQGGRVSFDSYFNALFEYHWRSYAQIGAIRLELWLRGSIDLRVFRRTVHGNALLTERHDAGHGMRHLVLDLGDPPAIMRASGRLFFEVTARSDDVVIERAEWSTVSQPVRAVGLVPVLCTFNREALLADVLDRFAQAPDLLQRITAIVVVNQGTEGLARHPGVAAAGERLDGKLLIIEQGNFGGAGGFTRGLLAAQEIAGASHVLFMDDDVVVDTESIRRTIAFFAHAAADHCLGGHMLDGLKPTELYEAGACIDEETLYLRPLRQGLDLTDARNLDGFFDIQPCHYNGWWYFGFPLAAVEKVGLPMPCFIRCDDVEFGRRLHDNQIFTASLPGVAIWHEPFYVKLGGWHLYYDFRNALVTSALHYPKRGRAAIVILVLKRVLSELLTFRYYNAALLLRAVEAYLEGPALFQEEPAARHRALQELRQQYPSERASREQVLPLLASRRVPSVRPALTLLLLWAVVRNWFAASNGPVRTVKLGLRDFVWLRVFQYDRLAVDSFWDNGLLVFPRSRAAFRKLFGQMVRILWRLSAQHAGRVADWQAGAADFCSAPAWRKYLGLASPRVISAPDTPRKGGEGRVKVRAQG